MDKKELNSEVTTENVIEKTENEMVTFTEVKFKEHPIQWVKQHPVKAALAGLGFIGLGGLGFGLASKHWSRDYDDGGYNEIETTYADEESPVEENDENEE